ncbi:MAG: insulinase family protein [Elusimicrobia bacterium]|nr:insulinase family protein [Candidatus Liberimonas magnetica]
MKLDNGLTVIIKKDNSLPIVSVQVWVRVGSVNESDKTSGLSHFLEHLLFKGTKDYPGTEISRIVETQGGVINAATSKELTYFYIDSQKDGLADAVKILADAMANATFPPDEIDNERPVVIEEIMRHYDDTYSLLYDAFSKVLYLKTPYRRSVIGSEDVIKNVTRQEISDYYKAHYTPKNMFLAVSGDLDTEKTIGLIKATFGKQKLQEPPSQPALNEPLHTKEASREKRNVKMSYLFCGFLGPDITSGDQFAADITGLILGGTQSSRLYRGLRENKQLVYSINSSYSSQRGTGAIYVSAMFAKENEQKVIDEINKEINALMESGPSDEEVKRAKEITKSQWYFDNETFHDKAALYAYWELQGIPDMPKKYIKNIDKVKKEDVAIFLKKYYKPQGMSYSIILPEEEK